MLNESTHGDLRLLVSGEGKGDQYNKMNEVSNLQCSLLIWLNGHLSGKKIQNYCQLSQTSWSGWLRQLKAETGLTGFSGGNL